MSRQCVLETVANFRETGTVVNNKSQIEPQVRNETTKAEILGHVELNHTLRKLATVEKAQNASLHI